MWLRAGDPCGVWWQIARVIVASSLQHIHHDLSPFPLASLVSTPSQEAIHGLSAEQSKNGFVLTCQTHPTGPGLEVELGMYDTVYESQYGQYEKKVSKAK